MAVNLEAPCENAGVVTTGPTIVIAAGGTGGHIYPGLALAEAITEMRPDARVEFVGTSKGLESDLIPDAGYELHLYDMVQFAGQGWRKATVPAALLRSSLQARRILKELDAGAAVSMGGYSGIPLVVGARLARVPSLVHEPGAVPGKANLLATRFTRNVATSFPQTRFLGVDARYVGYPLRGAITTFDRSALRAPSRAAYDLPDGVSMILVTGGSQGARSLNELALGLARRWAGRDDLRIVLKAGARHHEKVAADLRNNPGRELVELVRYIDRMDQAYAAADMAVTRAGAGTVAELAVVGLPSVLVPFPYDEHNEQVHNAEPLIESGGAVLVRDDNATPDEVGPLLEERLADPARLDEMRAGMRANAKPDAAAHLAAWALDLAALR
jgi:UDP-N-acetylglucosamine--N-acetylmuramyl-(pentapeptide) pyrophosphoryl-undecaprenol N-acetylglucosamine transferase